MSGLEVANKILQNSSSMLAIFHKKRQQSMEVKSSSRK
jgi:hypothetical protein